MKQKYKHIYGNRAHNIWENGYLLGREENGTIKTNKMKY